MSMKTKLLVLFFITIHWCATAQWEQLYTFQTPAYAFTTFNNNLYVGLSGGGVYMSQDSGYTWVAKNNGIQMGGAYIYSFTSRNDSLFAGGFGEVNFSNDYGANWSLLNLNLDLNDFVFDLAIKDDFLFAGIGHGPTNGVYRKPMNGSGWSPMNNGLPSNAAVNALMVFNNNLLAGTDEGVYASINNGADWTWSGNGINAGLSVKSFFFMNGNILAGTTDGVFVSSDTGSTWNYSNGLDANSVGLCFTGNENYVIAGTYSSSYYSSDNGLNWVKISNGTDTVMSFFSMTSMGNYFYSGTGGGISVTNGVSRLSYLTLSLPDNKFMSGKDCSVTPNPCKYSTTIRLRSMVENANLSIYNLYGQKIKTMDNISGITISLSVSDLPGGCYYFRMTQDSEVIANGKLIIAN
jgi:photosystem II stability/assembly factor-like uncharacterized protein